MRLWQGGWEEIDSKIRYGLFLFMYRQSCDGDSIVGGGHSEDSVAGNRTQGWCIVSLLPGSRMSWPNIYSHCRNLAKKQRNVPG